MNWSLLISVGSFIFLIIGFFIARYADAKKAGEREKGISTSFEAMDTKIETKVKEVQTEIDTRVKSVCEKHDADIRIQELERKHLEKEFGGHVGNNEKEHSELFSKMNNMAKDITEIKTGVAILVAEKERERKEKSQ